MDEVQQKLIKILGTEQLTRKELFASGSDFFTIKQMETALKKLLEEEKVWFVDRKYYEVAK